MQLPQSIEPPSPRVIAYGMLGIAGIILGYLAGTEAAEQAAAITSNQSPLISMVRDHPTITTIAAMGLGPFVMEEVAHWGKCVYGFFRSD